MCSTAFHSQAFKVGRHSSNLDGGDVCGREHYGHEITGMLQKKDAECRRNTQFSFASSLCWKYFFFFFSALFSATVPMWVPLLPCTTGLGVVILLMNVATIV